ncbi:MAG: hypothetical protein ACXAEI_12850 [Candidatus Hodarchaeales archaeon]
MAESVKTTAITINDGMKIHNNTMRIISSEIFGFPSPFSIAYSPAFGLWYISHWMILWSGWAEISEDGPPKETIPSQKRLAARATIARCSHTSGIVCVAV